jgi:formylglycine-generating enzyme required for sulfatase activity
MRRILLLLMTALVVGLLALPAQAARLALVIGNDAYQKVDPLKNARNDARLMASILQKAGFDVTQASNLGRDSLWSTIDTFKGRINKGDEVVFYFAGHGVQIGANQLLLPTDIEARNDAQVQRDGVPLLDVQDALKDARVAVLLLDACRDNPFPKTGTRTVGGSRGLTPPEPSTGQIIMMSAGRNQKALDYVPNQQQGNGLFTWELSQVLLTPGIEIRAALEQVKERVDTKARKAGHEQRPSLVNDLSGNFYFTGGNAVQLASQKPEHLTLTASPGQMGGLSLDDLQKEEETRQAWGKWQGQMQADFDKTVGFNGSSDLQTKAWQRFLAAWAQDNPLSRQDDDLRSQATTRQQSAQQQSAAQKQPQQYIKPSSPASLHAGQGFKDCQEAHCPEMVVIPEGNFQMGSHDGDADEKPLHSVNIKRFSLGKYEVTQGQWKALMGSNPSNFSQCGDNCPVEKVRWDEIQQYIQKLNTKSGQQYRLPSEAEWEYAARAGSTTRYSWGNDIGRGNANCKNCGSQWDNKSTAPVGSFMPNAFGLHDMHGNVWEWVQDWFHYDYNGAPTDGSAWVRDGEQRFRVLRSGSWSSYEANLRSGYRAKGTPNGSKGDSGLSGFRLARNAP